MSIRSDGNYVKIIDNHEYFTTLKLSKFKGFPEIIDCGRNENDDLYLVLKNMGTPLGKLLQSNIVYDLNNIIHKIKNILYKMEREVGFTHSDLHLNNILINGNGETTIIDFGPESTRKGKLVDRIIDEIIEPICKSATLAWIKSNPTFRWNRRILSVSGNLLPHEVEDLNLPNIEGEWDFKALSFFCSIRMVIENPNLPWDKASLSGNSEIRMHHINTLYLPNSTWYWDYTLIKI